MSPADTNFTSLLNATSSVEEEIAANDVISRVNYAYSLLAALGLGAGCFLLYSFVQMLRTQRRPAWVDGLLWAFCGVQLLLLLLSLYAAAHRPRDMEATALGCAALSFAINAASLSGLLVLVLTAYVLTLDPPPHAPLRQPGVCVAVVLLTSVLVALALAAVRGLDGGGRWEEPGRCFADGVRPVVPYAAAKLCLAFLAPYALQLALLAGGCVRQWRSRGRFLSGSEEGPVFLAVTAVTFCCHLFYGVVLLRDARLHRGDDGRVLLRAAELVLFSASSFSLVLVLLLHRPCRHALHAAATQLRDCCRSPGRTQPNRNIIAPHIEITDTLQDIES